MASSPGPSWLCCCQIWNLSDITKEGMFLNSYLIEACDSTIELSNKESKHLWQKFGIEWLEYF